MAANQVLALDNAAFGEAKGLRRGEEMIDSIAYAEGISNEARRNAENMIKQEMTKMGKRPADYLPELPKLHQVKFTDHPLLQAEYERVKAQQPMVQTDEERLKCLPPSENRKNDVSAWHTSLNNAHSQLEHQYNRLLNLELLLEHGTKAWQAHIRSLEIAAKRVEARTASLKKETEEVNVTRSLKHKEAGKEISELHKDWTAIIQKNSDIAKANALLDKEIAELRAKLPESERMEEQPLQDEQMQEDASEDTSEAKAAQA